MSDLQTFRFSGGCAGSGKSITVQLTGPYVSLALLDVQGWRQASTAVVSKSVSKVGARPGGRPSADPAGLDLPGFGWEIQGTSYLGHLLQCSPVGCSHWQRP